MRTTRPKSCPPGAAESPMITKAVTQIRTPIITEIVNTIIMYVYLNKIVYLPIKIMEIRRDTVLNVGQSG